MTPEGHSWRDTFSVSHILPNKQRGEICNLQQSARIVFIPRCRRLKLAVTIEKWYFFKILAEMSFTAVNRLLPKYNLAVPALPDAVYSYFDDDLDCSNARNYCSHLF
jgi:hypothetical protein